MMRQSYTLLAGVVFGTIIFGRQFINVDQKLSKKFIVFDPVIPFRSIAKGNDQ